MAAADGKDKVVVADDFKVRSGCYMLLGGDSRACWGWSILHTNHPMPNPHPHPVAAQAFTDQTSQAERAIAYFTATWCPPCRTISPVYSSLRSVSVSVKLERRGDERGQDGIGGMHVAVAIATDRPINCTPPNTHLSTQHEAPGDRLRQSGRGRERGGGQQGQHPHHPGLLLLPQGEARRQGPFIRPSAGCICVDRIELNDMGARGPATSILASSHH